MLNQIIYKVIKEATSDNGGGRGAYIPPMQPGLRSFDGESLQPFTTSVSDFKSPLVQYDSYDGEFNLRLDQIKKLEKTASKIQDYIKNHPYSHFQMKTVTQLILKWEMDLTQILKKRCNRSQKKYHLMNGLRFQIRVY